MASAVQSNSNTTNGATSPAASSMSRKRTRDSVDSDSADMEIPQILVTVPKAPYEADAGNFFEGPQQRNTSNYSRTLNGSSASSSASKAEAESRVEHMTICKPAPFSTDPEACLERDRCDYNTKITYQMARNGNTQRKIRVYADGIYDLFHQGHARQLMQAKNVFPNVYLIVGICSDELTHSRKGRTVMNDAERYEAVRHCRYVDEIITEAPWEISDEYLEKHKIDFVAHDDIPYVTETLTDIYAPLKQRGMFVATERTDGVSTSDVVARIVKDYDVYVRRNLARGYSARDLNVGFLNEKKFKLQNKMDELRDKWEEKSREFIENFLNMFGKDNLSSVWNKSKGRMLHLISPNGSENGDDADRDEDLGDEDDDDVERHSRLVPPPSKRPYLYAEEDDDAEEAQLQRETGAGDKRTTNGHGHESGAGESSSNGHGHVNGRSNGTAAVEA